LHKKLIILLVVFAIFGLAIPATAATGLDAPFAGIGNVLYNCGWAAAGIAWYLVSTAVWPPASAATWTAFGVETALATQATVNCYDAFHTEVTTNPWWECTFQRLGYRC
jgi:hypothetical protein